MTRHQKQFHKNAPPRQQENWSIHPEDDQGMSFKNTLNVIDLDCDSEILTDQMLLIEMNFEMTAWNQRL